MSVQISRRPPYTVRCIPPVCTVNRSSSRHASEDKDVAEPIQVALASAGYTVFYDRESLPPGGDYHARIRSAIAECDLFIFLISPESIKAGKFTLTELKFARERWPSPVGRVLSVNLHNLAANKLPPYSSAATHVSVAGSPSSEVRAAVDNVLLAPARIRYVVPPLLVESASLPRYWRSPGWHLYSRNVVNLAKTGSTPFGSNRRYRRCRWRRSRIWLHLSADMSIGNIGPEPLLVNRVGLGITATSTEDGSTLGKSFEPVTNRTLPREGLEPVRLTGETVKLWTEMGKATSREPQFSTHFFSFWIQVQATIPSSGKRVVLDVEAPSPMSMNCLDRLPCEPSYINVATGASGYKKCMAVPAQRNFTLDCQTRESF